jgi:hypothetical protein
LTNHFITEPGQWTGSGLITFSKLQNQLPFRVEWSISKLDDQRTQATQRIILDPDEPRINAYVITKKTENTFDLLLENNEIGVFSGKGVYDPAQIAWEFSHFGKLEGLEVYQKENASQYSFTAEYTGGEDYSTKITGTLQRK